MSEPYRDGGSPYLCPRCGDPLLVSNGAQLCGRGCGEWIGIAALRDLSLGDELAGPNVRRRTSFAYVTGACVTCGRAMEARSWANALFEMCSAHGVWLDARFRPAFHQRLAEAAERERAARELADRLAAATPADRLDMARRIVALERRVAELERRDRALRGEE